MTQPWNMARAAAHRRPHHRSVFKPVGSHACTYELHLAACCDGCGHHLCSCPPRRAFVAAMPTLAGLDGARVRLGALPGGWTDQTACVNTTCGTRWGAVFRNTTKAWTVVQCTNGRWACGKVFNGTTLDHSPGIWDMPDVEHCWSWLDANGHL